MERLLGPLDGADAEGAAAQALRNVLHLERRLLAVAERLGHHAVPFVRTGPAVARLEGRSELDLHRTLALGAFGACLDPATFGKVTVTLRQLADDLAAAVDAPPDAVHADGRGSPVAPRGDWRGGRGEPWGRLASDDHRETPRRLTGTT